MAQFEEFDISPDPTLMEDIGATSFSVADAIVELIANSVDARVDEEKLEIVVDVSPETIRVIDDGAGMSRDDLAEAVRLGVKMDQLRARSGRGRGPRKGMYGLGMKTAAASLGRRWAVHTRPAGGDEEHRVEFDLDAWRGQSGKRGFRWRVTIETGAHDPEGPLGGRERGTAIVVTGVRERSPMPGPVLDKLGHAYKPNIENDDVILVNGEAARAPAYNVVENSRVEVDEELDEGKRVTGWIALDKQTHNDGRFGLNLYRRGQLIEAWNKDWFNPHPMTSRLLGELNVDFVQPNFHKQGFEKTTDDWKLLSNFMRDFLRPVVKASQEMSRGRNDEGKYVRATEGLRQAMGVAGDLGEISGGADAETPETSAGSEASTPGLATGAETPADPYASGTDVEVEADTLVIDGSKIRLAVIVEDFQSEQTPWDYMFDKPSQELLAVVNANSSLFQRAQRDHELLGVLALADSVASFLVRERGFDADRARSIRDQWLHAALRKG
jgi:hypothetical protein